jgi:hypothetical protein
VEGEAETEIALQMGWWWGVEDGKEGGWINSNHRRDCVITVLARGMGED